MYTCVRVQIWKRGSWLRVDSSIAGYSKRLRVERGDMTCKHPNMMLMFFREVASFQSFKHIDVHHAMMRMIIVERSLLQLRKTQHFEGVCSTITGS